MLTASEIRNAKFSKSMSGYKKEEVDVLLDKIEADYVQYDRTVREFQKRNEELAAQVDELKNSQSSIQNALLNAQKFADNIVNEAKQKSEEIIKNAENSISDITQKEQEMSKAFEQRAKARKADAEKELEEMVKTAKLKADSITAAAEDSVARQQMLFEKLKMEIASFKASITAKYKEHLEILSAIPDSVPMDPEHIARIVAEEFDKKPDTEKFIKREEPETEDSKEIPSSSDSGFSVAEFITDETETAED